MMENRSTARGLREGIKETSVVMPVIRARLGLHKYGLHPTPQANPVDSNQVW
jgi:hypothetical protein